MKTIALLSVFLFPALACAQPSINERLGKIENDVAALKTAMDDTLVILMRIGEKLDHQQVPQQNAPTIVPVSSPWSAPSCIPARASGFRLR